MLSTQIGGEEPTEHAKYTKPDDSVDCQICGKKNHTAKRCHFRFKDERKNRTSDTIGVRKDTKPRDKRDKSNITCFKCHNKGHYSNDCPEKGKKKGGDGMSGWDEPRESSRMMRETDSA